MDGPLLTPVTDGEAPPNSRQHSPWGACFPALRSSMFRNAWSGGEQPPSLGPPWLSGHLLKAEAAPLLVLLPRAVEALMALKPANSILLSLKM